MLRPIQQERKAILFDIAHYRIILPAALAFLIPVTGHGAETGELQWSLCPPTGVAPPPELPSPGKLEQLHLWADEIATLNSQVTEFRGNVEIGYLGNLLAGDQASYDRKADRITISGNVNLNGQEMVLTGERAVLTPSQDSGEIESTRYHLRKNHAFGGAERIELIDKEHAHLESVSYTTCVPGHEDWLLKAKTIDLDYSTNTGEARSTTMRFKGVPFLYLPYMNFPLHGRKSGLLAPSAGASESRGTDITIPYYWNIAPHRDATFALRNMTARGAMLGSEFRYLNPSNNGQINFDYLPDDKRFNNEKRWFGHFDHQGTLGKGWRTELLYNGVSDDEYFNDLGSSQATTSLSHLERRADLSYQSRYWSLLGRAQGYQTLIDDQPYQRLPQLKLNAFTPEKRGYPKLSFDGELVNFDKDDTAATKGIRLDLYPALSMPMDGDAWFLKPRLALRYTSYQLENATEERVERTLPIASLDSGLFFERELSIGDHPYMQTLEPRLYYVYVPYENQDNQPVFDTSLYDFNFSQLFRENRFNGADRHGDANQLTLALTTRFLDSRGGAEKMSASLGQILYFRDREVTLPGQALESESNSPYIGELSFHPTSALDLTANARYNANEKITEVFTTRLRYHPDRDRSVSVGYRLRDELNEQQADMAGYWPLSPHWQLLAHWQYDLEEERNLDVVAGLEYRSCCWGARMVSRELRNTTTNELEHSIYFTFEFKGLSRIGNELDSELERGILGIP
jgi:LPS-assembly protein